MANWDMIRADYETSKMTLAELAEKHDVKLGSLKSKKSRDAKDGNPWMRGDEVATKDKKVATNVDEVATVKDARQSTKQEEQTKSKRSGNPNPQNQFTERNTAALKHGLFSRYIPQETLELMGMLDEKSPADLIWDQIQIQYAAIIRAQKIMFVESKDELIRNEKKLRYGYTDSGDQVIDEIEYEFQYAWDRHAQFLNAQSRAISELRTSINQFVKMAHEDDERKKKLQQMDLGLQKTRAEITRLEKMNEAGNQASTEEKLAEYFTALQGAFTNEPTDE